MSQLQRLIITFSEARGEMIVHVSYRRSLEDAPNPGTKARAGEVQKLARRGLRDALEALDSEAGVNVVGSSGFVSRQDILSASVATATTERGEAR